MSPQRRERGVRESLGSIVLGFELIILFLGALVAWGLKAAPASYAIGGGAVLVVLSILAIASLRSQTGVRLGWAVQVLAIVSGVWVHMMFIVGVLFLAIWIYAMYSAGRIERQKAIANRSETPS